MTDGQPIDVAAGRRMLLERMLSGEGRASGQADPVRPRDPARAVTLTAEQNQLWLHAQIAPDMPLYNESITIHRHGRYDHDALERALGEIVRRHAIWRTAFVERDGEIVQEIAPPRALPLPLIDLTDLPVGARDAEAVRLAAADARAPIPLDPAPLLRARVVRMRADDHRLYLTLHHVIFDGVSIYRTLMPELAVLVAAFEAGLPSPLAEPALQYADYAVWQADQPDAAAIERQIAYWRDALAGPLPRLELAGDRPRPALPTHAGNMEVFAVDEHLVAALREVARVEGATLYMVLLAAFKAMLFRYTGDTDLIVGGVTDTRRRPELQPLMGYFLNTVALRSRPAGDLPFRDYLAQVRRGVIGALGAADVPFDRLVRVLDIKRGRGTHPLFNTLFSVEPPVAPFPPGWDLTQMDVAVGAAKYDLYLELDERSSGMAGRILYSTELFDAATIRRMIGHWTRLLDGVAADSATRLADLPLLGADERGELIETWNDTARPLPHATVMEWFATQVAATPAAVAVEGQGERWSYEELASRADAIAARLVAVGVVPGALVGLAVDRSPWMLAAMLGVAKTGAAYLPLDPGLPPARFATIVEDARPTLVLVEPETAHCCMPDAVRCLVLDRDETLPRLTPLPIVDGEALAYVLYTSGSTGKPKSVEVPHAALVNLLAAMHEAPGLHPGETLLAITTLSFDIAGLELWLPLVSGGRVVIAPREVAMDMTALAAMIRDVEPDVMQATPATWRGLLDAGWEGAPTMRALCGGEALPRALAERLLPRVRGLWNVYGPTETTIWSTTFRVTPGDGPVPIGRPIANTQVRILDRAGRDLPIGAVGELFIGGRGVARGYRGRPDVTAERFLEMDGSRLYRTGDLARWRADGEIECRGRTDHEEKIRGFRVAIEEVEGALAKLPGVVAAAARAWPDPSGERALTGYLVGQSIAAEPHAWREALARTLPDYMIPTQFVLLDALPLTPNGKLDRAALPEHGTDFPRAATPPASPDEERLAAIWRAVLAVDEVSREDDFFDLGGHSLLVARMLRRIEVEYGRRVPMAALFRAPRLADMARLLSSGRAVENPALIPIQPHGREPQVVWLDGGSTFLPLAERLGPDQPFLGLSVDVVLENAGGCPRRFEDAADHVVDALRAIQPRGPYRLGGWCTSAILAYAVACRLRDAGEEVPLLMLAHPFHPVRAREIGAARFFVSKLRFHVTQSLRQPRGERWRYFRKRLRGLSDAAALAGGREAVLQPALRSALDRAAGQFVPQPYDGDIVIFQPEEHPDLFDFVKDWRALARGGFTAHSIPGGHRTMLEHPSVDVFAARMRESLATAKSVGRLRAIG